MAILAFPAVAAAGGVLPKAKASRAQVQTQARSHVNLQARLQKAAALESPRALGGFVFQPPATLDGPFVTNHIRIDTGVAAVQMNAAKPEIEIPGGPAKYDLRMGAIEERASVGVALAPQVGLGLDGAVVSYGGSNRESALHVGSGVIFGLRPGLKLGLVNDQNLGIAVGMHGYGIAARGMGMRPAGIIDGMVRQARSIMQDSGRMACLARGDARCVMQGVNIGEGASVDTSMLGAGMSLSAAKTIGQYVGVQAEVGGEASRVAGGNAVQGQVVSNARTIYAGTAASVDLAPIAPVGAQLEYRLDHSVIPVTASSNARVPAGAVGRSNMHRMSGGLYYTARSNLVLGVVSTYGFARANMPGASSGKPAHFVGGRLTVGYYF